MLRPLLGVAVILLIAYAFSNRKKDINLRVVGAAFGLQLFFAVFVLYIPFGITVLGGLAEGVSAVLGFSKAGTDFIFGGFTSDSFGFVFLIQVLPVIIFVSALMSVLYYLRIMPLLVKLFGGAVSKIIGTTPVESLCAAANIFFDQSQSPLVVRPYIDRMSDTQFFTVMVCGLSSISGAILGGYASMGISLDFLIAAAFMAAPGGLLMAKIMMPDDPTAERNDEIDLSSVDNMGDPAVNVVEAAANGALDGVKLASAIGGTLLAFVALIALMNGIVGGVGEIFGISGLSMDSILGTIFAPFMYLLGIPWEEAATAGNMVGQKLILNEFVAFANLAEIQSTLSDHTVSVVTFALCGFANFSALAILLGGLGSIAPSKKHLIASFGLRAVAAGTLSNLMSAALASILIGL